MADNTAPETTSAPGSANPSSGDDEDGFSIFDIRKIIAGFIASGLATVLVEIFDQFRRAGGQLQAQFATIGSTFQEIGREIASTLLKDVFAVPFEILDSVVASSGPLAPLVAPAAWALSAAIIGAVLWTIWRVLGWL